MSPGDMVEVLGHPAGVRSVLREGIPQVKVDGKWKTVEPTWRPAVYAGWSGHEDIFRWTDNLHFTGVPHGKLGTLVREPRNGTVSQENYVRGWGELC